MSGKFVTTLDVEQLTPELIQEIKNGPVADEFPDNDGNFYPVVIVRELDDDGDVEYVVYSG